MQTTAHREQPHGLHERAISALLRLIDDRDACLPSLAEVARSINEPPARLNDIYDDNRALLITGIEQSLILLMDTCTRAVVKVDPKDPFAQFIALGNAYLDWADKHRIEFRMMSDGGVPHLLQEPSLRRYVESLTELMTRMMTRARDEGQLHPREDIALLVLSSRSYAYGLARMLVDGRMAEWAPERPPLATAKMLTLDFVTRIARSSKVTATA